MTSKFLNQIIHFIEEELGLKSHSISLLVWEDVLKERMRQCHLFTYEEYVQQLLGSPHEVQELIEQIVIPETWFFRDRSVFNYLLLWAKQAKIHFSSLKILSLACSTGEEPYSIAMTFFEAGLSRHAFLIDAIDISKKALMKAQRGTYQNNSFRCKDLHYRDHYFDKTRAGYAINDKIKNQVHLHYGNILVEKMSSNSQLYHVIFCRNLLIYLNKEAQGRVLTLIKSLLAPDGILIVGSAEMQIVQSAGFVLAHLSNICIFKFKRDLIGQAKFSPQDMECIKQRRVSLVSQTQIELNRPENFPVSSLENSSNRLFQEAMQLANTGQLEESLQACFKFMKKYGVHSDIFFLLGLINQAKGHEEKAEEFYQKAIYLKPSHYEALVCLALLSERKGDLKKAEIFHQRAKKSL